MANSLSPRAPEYARSSGLKGPGEFWSPAMATTVASFWPLLVPGLAQVHVVHGMSRDGRAPPTWRKKHQTPSRRFLENHPAPRVRQHPPRARADATRVILFNFKNTYTEWFTFFSLYPFTFKLCGFSFLSSLFLLSALKKNNPHPRHLPGCGKGKQKPRAK